MTVSVREKGCKIWLELVGARRLASAVCCHSAVTTTLQRTESNPVKIDLTTIYTTFRLFIYSSLFTDPGGKIIDFSTMWKYSTKDVISSTRGGSFPHVFHIVENFVERAFHKARR
jgi:hypothetical protein